MKRYTIPWTIGIGLVCSVLSLKATQAFWNISNSTLVIMACIGMGLYIVYSLKIVNKEGNQP